MKKTTTKKCINSCSKGKRTENELCSIFAKRFNESFARTGGSGARPKQSRMDKKAALAYTGDVICPEGFRFSIESKSENVDVDLLAPSAKFDQWLAQAKDDAASVGKQPMLCWKQPRKGWIVAIHARAFKDCGQFPICYVRYGYTPQKFGWVVTRLDAMLEVNQEHEFWFQRRED